MIAGADPRALSNSPYATYPIHFAAQSRGTHALEALVESGVDVDIAGEDGTTALHLATFHAYWPAVYFLIEAGADPYAVSSRYETPVALSRYHPDIMTLLGTLNLEQEGQ